jgi:hypothetical protein
MRTREEVIAHFEEWDRERDRLSAAEGEGEYPDASEWHASDDEGIGILWEAIELLRQQA